MITENETAFPFVLPRGEDDFSIGLTIRQYYAGLAMQGMVGNSEIQKLKSVTIEGLVIEAVQYADALIAELNKPTP